MEAKGLAGAVLAHDVEASAAPLWVRPDLYGTHSAAHLWDKDRR